MGKSMPYKIGISTGWWQIAKAPELLGMHLKAAYAATAGVTFAQIDLETTAEFFTPDIEVDVKRIQRDLGIEIGLHGEIGASAALESSLRKTWEQSHVRLVETVKRSAELGFTYVNLHWSSNAQLAFEEDRYWIQGYFYPVVSFDGEPLWTLCEKSELVKKHALDLHIAAERGIGIDEEQREWMEREHSRRFVERVDRDVAARRQEISAEYAEIRRRWQSALKEGQITREQYDAQMRAIEAEINARLEREVDKIRERWRAEGPDRDLIYTAWKRSNFGRYIVKAGEISAYILVGYYMMETRDPLWVNIVEQGRGKVDPWDAYFNKSSPDGHARFNAAVAAKYILGHLQKKGAKEGPGVVNSDHLNGMSVLEWLNKKKLYLTFEVPEVSVQHAEGQYRLFDPVDGYWLVKASGSKWVRQCVDFEHLLSQKRNPEDVIRRLPADGGSTILLFHLGTPLPYGGTAHIPIPRGSKAQEQIYGWIYALKKKGFGEGYDGYMVYERGGGQTTLEVLRDSVQALRLIKEYLEKDIPPNELPEAFYGISEQNEGEFKRQRVTVLHPDNAFAPLKGLIAIPEETYTFLGSQAVQKGKTEEWLKGRYR